MNAVDPHTTTRAVRVLIVDDSVVFRTQITSALTGIKGIEIVGTAANGSIALQKLAQISCDAVTIDMEMPDMDGIALLREIRNRGFPVKKIVFSSQTTRGAEKALEALREGADDIVAKPSMGVGGEPALLIREALAPKVLQFLPETERLPITPRKETQLERYPKVLLETFQPSVIVIASSTGGPSALEEIFTSLARIPKVPILIAQHMPPVFTQILAGRIQQLSKIPCKEAQDGDPVKPGNIYIAPGDFHLHMTGTEAAPKIELSKKPSRNSVRPAADYLFESAASIYGSKCLGIVLTGMGEDGLVGAQSVKLSGGGVYIQNKESCVVFGMPGAVHNDGCYDRMGDLKDLVRYLTKFTHPPA